MMDMEAKQSVYFKERIDTVDKTTGIFERTINRQENEIKQLNDMLAKSHINPHTYDIIEVVTNVKSEFKDSIKSLTEKIEALDSFCDNDFDAVLALANAYAASEDWIKAAEQYKKAS